MFQDVAARDDGVYVAGKCDNREELIRTSLDIEKMRLRDEIHYSFK